MQDKRLNLNSSLRLCLEFSNTCISKSRKLLSEVSAHEVVLKQVLADTRKNLASSRPSLPVGLRDAYDI
jgi:hypothetical protein